MIEPDLPPDEAARLDALRALRILDTPPEQRFDRITSLAARLLRVPWAYISLVDADRVWVKSQVGMLIDQMPRDVSFCGHVILGDQPVVLPDTTADERFVDNPQVLGPEGVRSYAGVPLGSEGGHMVGALCVADHRARTFSDDEIQILKDLGTLVERELGLLGVVRLQEDLLQAHRKAAAFQRQVTRDLEEAAAYVRSRLPNRLSGEVSSDWRFIPSQTLGGDMFDHYWLDRDHLVVYLVDVSGHGVGAALLSTAVMNVLRAHALADTDLRDPAAVLAALNDRFQMAEHGNRYFTIWYGVYDRRDGTFAFSTGGHPPGVMFVEGKPMIDRLGPPGPFIGAFPGTRYEAQTYTISRPSSLLLFSDGLYEIEVGDGVIMGVDEFIDLLECRWIEPAIDLDGILSEVRGLANGAEFSDDVTVLRLDFALMDDD